MKQFSKLSMYALTAALAGFMISACGEDPIPGDVTCATDSECGDGNICHPAAKQCVQSCTAGSDCPDSAKTCASFGGSAGATDGGTAGAGSALFCQCSTTPLCGGAEGTSVICSTSFKICTVKCSTDSVCPSGYSCDTASGDCKVADCTTNANLCTAGQSCDAATKTCVTTQKCDPASSSIDGGSFGGCAYGEVCRDATVGCVPVQDALPTDCPGATGKTAWNKAGLSPVILSATAARVSTSSGTSECAGGGAAVEVTLEIFAPNGLTTHAFGPSAASALDFEAHARFHRTASGGFTGSQVRPRTDVAANAKYIPALKYAIACGETAAGTAAININDETSANVSNTVCVNF